MRIFEMSSYSTDRPHVARALAAAGVTVGAACLYMHWSSREDASSCREAPVEPLPAPAPAVKTSSPLRAGEPGQLKDDVSSSNLAEVFVRGINKKASRDSILAHFSGAGEIKSLRWTMLTPLRTGWIVYDSPATADRALLLYNHSSLHGTNITIQKNMFSTVQSSSVIPRHIRVVNIQEYEKYNKKAKAPASVSYSRNGLLVNGVEYPTPHGNYLRKILEKAHRARSEDLPVLDLLLENTFGNKSQHTKEISETMAMVNAILKLGSLTSQSWVEEGSNEDPEETVVYVLGDGKTPYTALCIAMYMPAHWKYVSVDPLMNFDPSTLGDGYADRIIVERKLSQEYIIDDRGPSVRNIVIACHSHAPLQEFWDRLSHPKFCVSMPCCKAQWSHLTDTPLCEYEDYEVFSPKRLVKLYHSP